MVLLAFHYMYFRRNQTGMARHLKGFQGRGMSAHPSTNRYNDFDHSEFITSQGSCRSIGSLDRLHGTHGFKLYVFWQDTWRDSKEEGSLPTHQPAGIMILTIQSLL